MSETSAPSGYEVNQQLNSGRPHRERSFTLILCFASLNVVSMLCSRYRAAMSQVDYETGRQIGLEICAIIDRAIAQSVIPDAVSLLKLFEQRLRNADDKGARFIAAQQAVCETDIQAFTERAKDTVLAELADWNDWITTEGVRDLVDNRIDRKLKPVIDVIAQGVKDRVKNTLPPTSSIQPSLTVEKYKKLITTQLADIFDRITTQTKPR